MDPSASTIGSVYIFTYTKDAFRGMLKIGYTSKSILHRLNKWNECGHGFPVLRGHRDHVRHPGRIELLTHFELVQHWYALRWCEPHRQAHIEWFKIGHSTANQIVQSWSIWIERANPYDRRGRLKVFWKGIIQFLTTHEIYITAELMMQIQEIEEGSIDLADFIDDDALRKQHELKVMQDNLDIPGSGSSDRIEAAFGSPKCIRADPKAETYHDLKSMSVKIETVELQNTSNEVGAMRTINIKKISDISKIGEACSVASSGEESKSH